MFEEKPEIRGIQIISIRLPTISLNPYDQLRWMFLVMSRAELAAAFYGPFLQTSLLSFV